MDIQFVGEHLLPGHLGEISIFLAFATALCSIFLYYQASKENPVGLNKWKTWGRKAYYAHSFLIFIASMLLMYILLNRYYEYRYVWVHVENDLGLGYMIASFWAGQEGSLLFWILCQMVFGLLLIRYAGKWESHVMVTVGLSQLFMVSMILGVHVFGTRIGMNPFLLLREVPENAVSDFFQNPNYLSLIVDGNGLNPLLRNFWMLSHPPVTFIGFAAALVPFAYAIAGLWRREYISWITPALPWTMLAVFFLGAGILLGGVWAYESLTFGGFWAWDPIENASLVPWLILVASLHLMLVARKKRENILPTFLFTFLTFIFVIYCTYLTRSGVLADTSVHSFGDDGMGSQILSYIFVFLLLAIVMLVKHFRKFPSKENEEPLSREFWLFIGAMVLVLSAFQIIFTTSIPVINKLVGSDLAPPLNVVHHYNTWQLPFAIFLALLIGFTHFMKWGRNEPGKLFFSSLFSLSLAFVFTAIIFLLSDISHVPHIVFLFAGLFAMFSSIDMVLRFRSTLMNTPALISHLGMALFFIAILITFSQQQTISRNTSGFKLGESFSEHENLLLIRDKVLPMGEYHVKYTGRQLRGEDLVYQIDFLRKNQNGEFYRVFSSFPYIKLNERMGNVYNPYAKVYLTRDIFTYITFADVNNHIHHHNPQLLEKLTLTRNDTVLIENNKVVLTEIEVKYMNPEGDIYPNNFVLEAFIEFITDCGKIYQASPVLREQDQHVKYDDAVVIELDYRVRLKGVDEKDQTIDIEVYREQHDFIIIKSIIFPFINLLWISCIVMLLGFWLSFRKRWKARNRSDVEIANE